MATALKITATGIVKAMPIKIIGVLLVAGSDAASVTLYDNASAGSGSTIVELTAPIGESRHIDFVSGVTTKNGVYATLVGTGAKLYVYEM